MRSHAHGIEVLDALVHVTDQSAEDETPREAIVEPPAQQAKLRLGSPRPGARRIGVLRNLHHASHATPGARRTADAILSSVYGKEFYDDVFDVLQSFLP